MLKNTTKNQKTNFILGKIDILLNIKQIHNKKKQMIFGK